MAAVRVAAANPARLLFTRRELKLMRQIRALEDLVRRLESASWLDRPSEAVVGLLRRLIRPGAIEDLLSGTPLGHPAHPILVAVPIGSWSAVLVLDATGADPVATRRLVAFGNLTAVPAALTGASDWLSTAGAERRVGLVHATANYTALALHGASWLARRRGERGRGAALSAAGLALAGAGGWLGGHLAFALGVGVDTTAFQKLPSRWTDAAADADVHEGEPHSVQAGGVPILLVRHEGRVVGLADRCTHRGGPLHEGTIVGGCVTCPWHGSEFALTDGSVISGPATRPQPTLEVRVSGQRIQVRRHEVRTLRSNPVGH